ncbi:hypothetical protein GCM10027035_11530 [Emticicia sediminis]
MIKYPLLYLLLILSTYTFSQKRASAIYGEILGQTSLFSVNFDSRFNKSADGLGFRVGYGVSTAYACKYCDFIVLKGNIIPISINYLLGKKKHHIELGTGITASIAKKSLSNVPILGLGIGDYTPTKNYGTFTLGYRYQEISNSIVFGLAWMPTYNKFDLNPRNFGISLGVNLK